MKAWEDWGQEKGLTQGHTVSQRQSQSVPSLRKINNHTTGEFCKFSLPHSLPSRTRSSRLSHLCQILGFCVSVPVLDMRGTIREGPTPSFSLVQSTSPTPLCLKAWWSVSLTLIQAPSNFWNDHSKFPASSFTVRDSSPSFPRKGATVVPESSTPPPPEKHIQEHAPWKGRGWNVSSLETLLT